ncbi:hypothetical protein [Pseudomonas syringae group genomosp. 3]|uniref:hypothetical protein n=1 Tax=Pseudomonas syringae group genomosp. 3 TaxID=251701 RepID=UPI001604C6EF|nr:hypothetical protein [Pseudomonas syringae group genomosp. 3]
MPLFFSESSVVLNAFHFIAHVQQVAHNHVTLPIIYLCDLFRVDYIAILERRNGIQK